MSVITTAATPEELIADSRERIDAIDDRIIGLIQERTAVSTVIQEARIAAGGRRVHLSRDGGARALERRPRQARHRARDDPAGAVPGPRLTGVRHPSGP